MKQICSLMWHNTRYRSLVYLVMCALLWSTGGVVIKWIPWHPLAIAGLRGMISAIVIGIAFRGSPLHLKSSTQWAGAVAYAALVVLFVAATKLTTAANAILLQYTAPIYVALVGYWFLHEKTSRLDWLTIVCVLGGMGLFFIDHLSLGGMFGNVLAIISGMAFAAFVICMRFQKDGSPFGSVLLGNVLTAIIGLPFLIHIQPDFVSCLGILFLGIFQLGLSYVFYTKAIPHVTAIEATLIPVLEPVLNPVWVFLLLGEVPGPWAVVGGLVVLVVVTGRCILVALQSAQHHA